MCPVGEDRQGRRMSLSQRIRDYLEFAATLLGVAGLLSGVIWMFAANEVRESVRGFIGVTQLAAQIEVIKVQQDKNVRAITSITPTPAIVEYDNLRTRVYSPCTTGELCEYEIRARRTPIGVECEAPKVEARIVIDKSGLQHIVDAPNARKPSKADLNWRSISSYFLIPPEVPPGIAEYVMRLVYECKGETVVQDTPRMPFEVFRGVAPDVRP